MREIQIICVNDGSTDSSPAILEEYAQKDGRIEVIHKENGGLSSARNAAYPYLKGEYTLFIDSDDWVDLQLCEKSYKKASESGAEIVVFSYTDIGNTNRGHAFSEITMEDKVRDEEKKKLLLSNYNAAWGKIWKTNFLIKNNLVFPEGLCFEDVIVNWQGVLLAEKVSILPEELYYYRQREDSITQKQDETIFDLLTIYQQLGTFLKENGYYSRYKDVFIAQKLKGTHYLYFSIKDELKSTFCQKAKEIIGAEEEEFLKKLPAREVGYKLFYSDFTGNTGLQRILILLKYFWRHPKKFIPWLVRRLHRKTIVWNV